MTESAPSFSLLAPMLSSPAMRAVKDADGLRVM
jgi:hypothetical protein